MSRRQVRRELPADCAEYDSSEFSPVCIDIKTDNSVDTVYKNDLVNKVGETWLIDTFQYIPFEDTARTIQMDDEASTNIAENKNGYTTIHDISQECKYIFHQMPLDKRATSVYARHSPL